MRAHLLHRDNPLSWSLIPEVSDRIAKFCEELGSDMPGPLLVEAYRIHFATREPGMIAFVGLDETGIVGHALLNIEVFAAKKYANVNQFKLDKPVPREELIRAYEQIVEWARGQGADEMQILALDERRARVFRQRYDFKFSRVLMRRPLAGPILSPSTPRS